MSRLRIATVVSLPIAMVALTACSDSTATTTEPTEGLVINASTYEPDVGTSLDIFPGTLQVGDDGCVYLQMKDAEWDLVWPTDYKTSSVAVYQTLRGTQLGIGKRVSLVGVKTDPDQNLTCRHTEEDLVIYVNNFLGKTTGGG